MKEEKIELFIKRLGINGEGVAHLQESVIFVEGALPQETVEAHIYEQKKTYSKAVVFRILNASSQRTVAVCPHYGECGGCQLMHLKYEAQLEAKRQRVIDALERIGKLKEVPVLSCRPSPSPLAYRNKIQLPVGEKGELGLYARSTHRIVEIESCAIHLPLGEKVFAWIKKYLKEKELKGLKHILIKTATFTEEVLVILVTTCAQVPGLLSFALALKEEISEVKAIVQNIHSSKGNVILGKTFHPLVGEGFIIEKLCGLEFKVSPASFFQVNPLQAENLYREVVKAACLTGKEKVLDAYSGVGTLSLLLAKEAKEVVGIECVKEATEDATENARRNQIQSATFLFGLAEDLVESQEGIDVAVLNPPRKGCEGRFLEKLLALAPQRILYISCDPATLARDLSILDKGGYEVSHVEPFDMFPQTAHVESLAVLQRKK